MERPEFAIHGKNLNAEEKEKVAKHFEETFAEGLEPVPGEIEKSEKVLRYIEKINQYLNDELASMGLDEVRLDARRIHILPTDDFKKEFPHAEANGVYRDASDGIYVKQDKSRLQAYKSLLHEVIHQLSFRSVYANPETRQTYVIRNGYANEQATEESHEHFRGLNEAVVDSIVKEVLGKHKDEITQEFSVTEAEQNEPVSYYDDYMEILDLVMEKIAEKSGEGKNAVWLRFKKGEFNGEMMHLRDIEQTFGKGALRVLGALGSGTKNMRRSELIGKMKEYFKTDDEGAKEKIAKEMLIERERLRYDRARH